MRVLNTKRTKTVQDFPNLTRCSELVMDTTVHRLSPERPTVNVQKTGREKSAESRLGVEGHNLWSVLSKTLDSFLTSQAGDRCVAACHNPPPA